MMSSTTGRLSDIVVPHVVPMRSMAVTEPPQKGVRRQDQLE
jgi:hypothetical protein